MWVTCCELLLYALTCKYEISFFECHDSTNVSDQSWDAFEIKLSKGYIYDMEVFMYLKIMSLVLPLCFCWPSTFNHKVTLSGAEIFFLGMKSLMGQKVSYPLAVVQGWPYSTINVYLSALCFLLPWISPPLECHERWDRSQGHILLSSYTVSIGWSCAL